MGKLQVALGATVLCVALAGCGSEAAEPPPGPTTSSTPSAPPAPPTATPSPTPPVMPEAAKAHTEEGAKAFVNYYMSAITYAEATLDTVPVEKASLKTCAGCHGGIEALREIADSGGSITGGSVSASEIVSGGIDAHGVVVLWFVATDQPETVTIPGKGATIHKGATEQMVTTLVARPTGWKVSEYRSRS